MAYQIRPLSFGEILDRSFRVVIDNAALLIAISAIVYVPEALLTSIGPKFALMIALIMLAVFPLLQAALATAVAEIYLDREITIERAYRSSWAIYLPFLGTYFLYYLIIGVTMAPVAMLAGFAGAASVSPVAIAIVAILIAMPVAVYLANRWALIGPVMVVERKFGTAALGRSGALVKGVWWQMFGIFVAAGLIVQVPVAVLSLIWRSIPILGSILTGLASSISWAYSHTVIVVYYFDRRCRLEDFDLLRLAEQIRSEASAGSPASTGAPTVG